MTDWQHQRAHLVDAGVAFVTARNAAMIGLDELAAAGIVLDYDLVGELERILADLRLIVSGRGSIAELRPETPEHAASTAIAYRQERARQSGGKVAA